MAKYKKGSVGYEIEQRIERYRKGDKTTRDIIETIVMLEKFKAVAVLKGIDAIKEEEK